MANVIWITGASSGIGAALARTAPPDARVIGVSRRPSAAGESVLADLADPLAWTELCRHISEVLDVERPDHAMLLHFAGAASPMGPATAADDDAYRDAVLLNAAAGQVLGTRFLTACKQTDVPATVVMCSSPAATTPRVGMTHYSAGKAALELWTRATALEQALLIRPAAVFCVVPYGVDTPMVRAAMEQPPEDLPLGEIFRSAAAEGRLADPIATAHEIWELIERRVTPGAAIAVGAVPSAAS